MTYTDSPIFNDDVEQKKLDKRLLKELKKFDPGYHRLKPKKKEREGVECYTSGNSYKSLVRNAITGERTDCLVGSLKEDDFFKVKVEGLTLFYYTPEEFERHTGYNLGHEVKQVWYEKQQFLKQLEQQK